METKELLSMDVVKRIMENSYYLVNVDYRDNLHGSELIAECFEKKNREPLMEANDWFDEARTEGMIEVQNDLQAQLIEMGYDPEEVEDFFFYNDVDIDNEIYARDKSDPVRDLLRNTGSVPVKIMLGTTDDYMENPWYANGEGGYTYNSYFGRVVDALNLNPRKVEGLLHDDNIDTYGDFPNIPEREGHELVSYKDFMEELCNTTGGANVLTILCKMDLVDLYDMDFKVKYVDVPIANVAGFFDPWNGGGSLLDMMLREDVEIDLTNGWRMEPDAQRGYDSIRDVYGVYDSIFGGKADVA